MKRLFSHKQKKFFSYFFLGLFVLSIFVPIFACFFAVSPLHEVKANYIYETHYSFGVLDDELQYVQSDSVEYTDYMTAVLRETYNSLSHVADSNGYSLPSFGTWVDSFFDVCSLNESPVDMSDFIFGTQTLVAIPWLSDVEVNTYLDLRGQYAFISFITCPRIPHSPEIVVNDNNNVLLSADYYPIIFTGSQNQDNYILGLGVLSYLRRYSNTQKLFFSPLFYWGEDTTGGIISDFTNPIGVGDYSSIYSNATSVAHVFCYNISGGYFLPQSCLVQPLTHDMFLTDKPQEQYLSYDNLALLVYSSSNYSLFRITYPLCTSFTTFATHSDYPLQPFLYAPYSSGFTFNGVTSFGFNAGNVSVNPSYNPSVSVSPWGSYHSEITFIERLYPTPTPIPTVLPTITPTPLPLEYDSHIDGYEDGSVNGFLATLKGYFDNLGSAFTVIPWLASSIGYMFYYLGPFSVFLFIPLIAFISFLLGRNKS